MVQVACSRTTVSPDTVPRGFPTVPEPLRNLPRFGKSPVVCDEVHLVSGPSGRLTVKRFALQRTMRDRQDRRRLADTRWVMRKVADRIGA